MARYESLRAMPCLDSENLHFLVLKGHIVDDHSSKEEPLPQGLWCKPNLHISKKSSLMLTLTRDLFPVANMSNKFLIVITVTSSLVETTQ